VQSDTRGPHVLIVGGFLTEPFNYWPMRRRLLRRGASGVSIAGIHIPDWLAAGVVGFGPILARTGRHVRSAWEAAGRRPLIVVAHSGGGILARLAMAHVPLHGRRAGIAPLVGCLVTLGTPHELARADIRFRHRGIEAARFLDAHTPGAWFSPTTAYLTVGSGVVMPGEPDAGPLLTRLRTRVFRSIVGPTLAGGSDGIVSLGASHLPGARQLAFTDVLHGHVGGPWYGDEEVIDRWWPEAVRLWRDALTVRGRADGAWPRSTVRTPHGQGVPPVERHEP
jgi:hypothetical protein